MTRAQLEHVIRAAAVISEDDEIVVIGSQAVLGQFPDAPADLTVSMEADGRSTASSSASSSRRGSVR